MPWTSRNGEPGFVAAGPRPHQRRAVAARASSRGRSSSSSSRRSSNSTPEDVLYRLDRGGVGEADRGDRERYRTLERQADLPPGLRAALPHPDARRRRPAHARRSALAANGPRRPRFQAMFCIDEREESIRRHLEEEVRPDCESPTARAGFFFDRDVLSRGSVADAASCRSARSPSGPQHWVVEEVVDSRRRQDHRRRGGHAGRVRHGHAPYPPSGTPLVRRIRGCAVGGRRRRPGLGPAGGPDPVPAADRRGSASKGSTGSCMAPPATRRCIWSGHESSGRAGRRRSASGSRWMRWRRASPDKRAPRHRL